MVSVALTPEPGKVPKLALDIFSRLILSVVSAKLFAFQEF